MIMPLDQHNSLIVATSDSPSCRKKSTQKGAFDLFLMTCDLWDSEESRL